MFYSLWKRWYCGQIDCLMWVLLVLLIGFVYYLMASNFYGLVCVLQSCNWGAEGSFVLTVGIYCFSLLSVFLMSSILFVSCSLMVYMFFWMSTSMISSHSFSALFWLQIASPLITFRFGYELFWWCYMVEAWMSMVNTFSYLFFVYCSEFRIQVF